MNILMILMGIRRLTYIIGIGIQIQIVGMETINMNMNMMPMGIKRLKYTMIFGIMVGLVNIKKNILIMLMEIIPFLIIILGIQIQMIGENTLKKNTHLIQTKT